MDVILYWMIQERRQLMLQAKAAQKDVTEDETEMERLLLEPIPGFTSDERFDELEAESFGSLMSEFGEG